jgi:hypothetical protein
MRGLENNVYAQIGLVMLIGLAAKNAILIVEFAKMEFDRALKRQRSPSAAALETYINDGLRLNPRMRPTERGGAGAAQTTGRLSRDAGGFASGYFPYSCEL